MVGFTKLRIKLGNNVKVFEMSSNDEDVAIRACSEQSKKKRGASELEEVKAKKKLKLDRGWSSQCLALLRLLRDHRFGGVFREPVDPVKWKIPDYFEIISKPMDLGTIRSKLLRNVYSSADEFASDVRLTFGNAMLYNPRDNMVHQMAKDLKEVFEDRWELLTKKKVQVDCSRQSIPSLKLKKPVPVKDKVSPLLKPLATKQLEQSTSSLKLLQKPVMKRQSLGAKILKSCNSSVSSLSDCQIMTTPSAQTEKSGCVSSQIATEVKKTFTAMPPLSPLRAAILKSQTILKAKHRKVLDQTSYKADLRIQKEQMERTQREEKARIEAEIREAALMRAKTELRQQRARERQYLENLEKTSGLEEYSFETYNKDLIDLCGTSNLTRDCLIELGLFLRNDYCPQMELELSGGGAIKVDDVEEGEIV